MGMTFYPELTLAEVGKIMTICSLKLIGSESSIFEMFYMEDELGKEDRKGY